MEITVTDLGECRRRLDVEVPFADIRPHIEKAYARYQKKVKIDGFRKGKIPASILKKQFGPAIESEVVEDLIQVFFRQAIEKEQLAVVAPGSVSDVTFEDGQPFRLTAEVEVEPDVEVTDYTGFKVEKEAVKVGKEEVEHTLQLIREERALTEETDRGAQQGDVVTGDVQALDASGVPLVGQKWPGRSFEIGKEPLGDLLNDQLDGVKAGDERRFSITQPAGEQEAGAQTDHYLIHVAKVEEKKLPGLDDDFARSLGGYESLDELRLSIQQRIEAQRQDESEQGLKFRISDEIIKRNDFTLPDAMVKNVLDTMWQEHLQQSQQQSRQPLERDQFDTYQSPQVRWNLKWHLLSDKIAQKEGITVSDDELAAEIDTVTVSEGKEDKKLKAWFKNPRNADRLRDSLREDKLMAFLKENVKIKEVTSKKNKAGRIPGGKA